MTSAEIYKLRTHRNPVVYAVVLVVGVLIPSIALVWYTPDETSTYIDAFSLTFGVLTILLAIELGGWLLGSEYRQGTVKRLLAAEPRRLRVLATKGAVGGVVWAGVMTVAALVGWTAARIVGSTHGVAVPWNGRALLAAGITGLIALTVAYSLSAVARSDTFAKVGTLALVLVVEPLVSHIPRFGDYTIASALDGVDRALTGDTGDRIAVLSTGMSVVTIAAWLTLFATAAAVTFARRDV